MRSTRFGTWSGAVLAVSLGGCGTRGASAPAPVTPAVTMASVQPALSCEADPGEAAPGVVTTAEARPQRSDPGPSRAPREASRSSLARSLRARIGSLRDRNERRRERRPASAPSGPSEAPAVSPPPPPSSSCAGAPDQTEAERVEARRVVERVNTHRAAGAWCGEQWLPPAAPLQLDARLVCAARAHSHDMATHDYFDHDDRQGRSPFERIDATGYPQGAAAENISAGRPDAEAVVAGWMDSPGHCANIMSSRYTEVGVGHATGVGRYRHYWTQTFGDG